MSVHEDPEIIALHKLNAMSQSEVNRSDHASPYFGDRFFVGSIIGTPSHLYNKQQDSFIRANDPEHHYEFGLYTRMPNRSRDTASHSTKYLDFHYYLTYLSIIACYAWIEI